MMNKNLTNKIDDEKLAEINGGVTVTSTSNKYKVGDIVEVLFPLYKKWTNRGEITDIRYDGDEWKYYVKFEDWFLPNGWVKESRIAEKVR